VENNLVKITIADNAKGLIEEEKQKTFDHLFTTKAVSKGTGFNTCRVLGKRERKNL